MAKMIYDFVRGCRTRTISEIAMAIDLAILKLGTAKSVCANLDVNRNTLTRWHNGEVKPRPSNLQALADLAEIPVVWLT